MRESHPRTKRRRKEPSLQRRAPSAAPSPPSLALSLAAALVLVLVLLLAPHAQASEGDASPAFWSCVRTCEVTGCATNAPYRHGEEENKDEKRSCSAVCAAAANAANAAAPPTPPLPLRLARWDCPADCKYLCMWLAEDARRDSWRAAAAAAKKGRAADAGDAAAAAAAAAAADAAATSPPQPPPPPPFETYKYFGKWPFTRVLGAQEIGSVITSLANLAAVAHNLVLYTRALRRASSSVGGGGSSKGNAAAAASSSSTALLSAVLRGRHPYPYAALWYAHGLLACNAWLWSAVFHTRDTRPTERLDYFSAGALVAAGLATALVRALGWLPHRPWAALLAAAAATTWWLSHVRYMSLVKFDYAYNMSVCIALGVAQALVWLAFLLLPQRQLPGAAAGASAAAASPPLRPGAAAAAAVLHPGRKPALLFLAAIHAAMLLEVLDFPPLFFALVDAHCLWHAATAPLAYLWWRFLLADVAWLAGGAGGGGGGGGAAAPVAAGPAGEATAVATGTRGGNASPGGASSGGDQEAGVERRRRRV